MHILKQPRFWLLVWGAAGAVFLLYVIVSASVSPRDAASSSLPSALDHDRALLVGEMEDFTYAFPPRGTPEIAFLHDGSSMSLNDFRGKAVLVNLWATWCAPCLKELPSLDGLQNAFDDEKFEVVAIAADPRGPKVAQDYLDRLEISHLKLYADPNLQFAFAMGGADVLPISVLYDANGQEVGRLIGEADWQSPEALALVRSVLP